MSGTAAATLGRFLSLPWNAFVGVFLYYTALALLVLSGTELNATFVLGSYLLPVAAVLALFLARAVRAVARYEPTLVYARPALAR